MAYDKSGKLRAWKKESSTAKFRSQIRQVVYAPKSKSGIEKKITDTAWLAISERKIRGIFKGPVCVDALFQYGFAASNPKDIKEQKRRRILSMLSKPDVDNLGKTVLDALNGVAFRDDQQVVKYNIIKCYGPVSGIRIGIHKADLTRINEYLRTVFPSGIEPDMPTGGLFKQ